MITEKSPSAMHPVPQPSRHLVDAHWDALELNLLNAILGNATVRQAARAKQVAL